MKRFICIILVFVILLTMVACGATSASSVSKHSTDNTRSVPVVDVCGRSLTEARKILTEAGFTNIVSNYDAETEWPDERIIVISQGVAAGEMANPNAKFELKCARLCQVYFDLQSEYNLFLNTYSMQLFFNGEEIGTVANGEIFTKSIEILEGSYEFKVCKENNNSVSATKKLDIKDDVTVSSKISHGGKININDFQITKGITGASIEVADVRNMVLSEAMTLLTERGFVNLREEPNSSIWNKDNWIVQSQSIEAGSFEDKNTQIVLDCIHLDDYFNINLSGKNISEAEAFLTQNGFSASYKSTSSNKSVDGMISTLSNDEKLLWSVDKAEQYSGKTATVYVTYNGTVSETPPAPVPTPQPTETPVTSPVPTPEPTPEPAKSSVYYSTNDADTVKDGNSGVYAYKSRGGQYINYWIIDFDEGYVYSFSEGNGEDSCDRIKIVSGDLNSYVLITYHDGSDEWSYALNFKQQRQPNHLILQDEDGFDYDFYPADLDEALKIRDTKTIYNY